MVDSIKSSTLSSGNVTEARTDKLRSSFKDVSSGLRVEKATEAAPPPKNPERTGKVVRNLNDAVSFSSLALESLEGLATEAGASPAEVSVVREFAEDLDKLRDDIKSVLRVLRSRAERAEIAQENLRSSAALIRDVDAATRAAESTGSEISQGSEKALEAHSNLDAERVIALLRD